MGGEINGRTLRAVSNCDNLLSRRGNHDPSNALRTRKGKLSKACSRSNLLFFVFSFLQCEHPVFLSFLGTSHPSKLLCVVVNHRESTEACSYMKKKGKRNSTRRKRGVGMIMESKNVESKYVDDVSGSSIEARGRTLRRDSPWPW